MLVGIAIEIPFALGEALIGVEAMVFRDWRVLQLVAYLPLIGNLADHCHIAKKISFAKDEITGENLLYLVIFNFSNVIDN